jgi:hypothetical protein
LVDADDLERAVRSASLPASDKVTADAAETVDRNLDLVRGDNGVVDGSLRVVIDGVMKDGSVSSHVFKKKWCCVTCTSGKSKSKRTRRERNYFFAFFLLAPARREREERDQQGDNISTRFLLPSGSISLYSFFLVLSLSLSSLLADEERPRKVL